MTNLRSLALFVLFVVTACGTQEAPHKQPFLSHRDALSTGLVISQVYGAGGNLNATYNADFVELFNRGTTPVNVSNWSVQYAGATAAAWEVASLSAFGSLQPGKYILIAMSPPGAVGSSLPTPNVSAPAVLMSGTAGKVALVNNSTALTTACPAASAYVDFVGYGGANCFETTPTANLSSISSAQRKTNGCIETDNNSNDFTVATPAPRNNAVAAFSCTSIPDAGMDAGVDAGTDAGTDAGRPDAGCLVISPWPSVYTEGTYQAGRETVFAELHTQSPAAADGGSLLRLEAYFGAGLTLPQTVTFSTNDTYGACNICPILARGCDSMGDCTQFFFAQAGSATVTTATQNVSAGSIVGSLSSVRFDEWDFLADRPVVPGQCVVVTTQVNVSWDAGTATGGGGGAAGGGAGGGGSTGGGAGGGSAGGGAGGGGGGSPDGGVKDGGAGGGTGGGRGGFGGGSGGGGGSADAGPRDAGVDAGSAGGGTGGGEPVVGGGTGSTGGGLGGDGGANPSGPGCGCSSDGQAFTPMLVMLLGALRLRRRRS